MSAAPSPATDPAGAPAPGPVLVVRDPQGRRRVFTLADGRRLVAGRRSACDVPLPWDPAVSRAHAVFVQVDGRWAVADEGLSRNGTFVNGTRVRAPHPLHDGDEVRLGQTRMAFLAADGPRSTAVGGATVTGERWFRDLAESSGDAIVRIDRHGRVQYASRSIARLTGAPPSAHLGRDALALVHPADRREVRRAHLALWRGRAEASTAFRIAAPEGGWRWVEATSAPVAGPRGRVAGVQCSVRDVTARHRREAEAAALRRLTERVALGDAPGAVFDAVAREAAALVDAEAALLVRAGPGGPRVAGCFDPDGLLVDPARRPGPLPPGGGGPLAAALYSGRPATGRLALGGRAAAPAIAAPVGDGGALAAAGPGLGADALHALAGFAAQVALAVEAAEARARLVLQATTDPLTGLANRGEFTARLDRAVAEAGPAGAPLALVLLDIDHFKRVNDEHGHPAGDRVLAGVAARLRGLARAGDTCARVGGEELAWLLPGSGAAEAAAAAERLRVAVAASREAGLAVTVSLGVAALARGGSAGALYVDADRALYRAKREGRDRVCAPSPPGTGSPAPGGGQGGAEREAG